MRGRRIAAGVALALAALPIVAFLATANYGAIGHHPARAITAGVVLVVAVALVFFGARLVRAGLRG